MAQSLNYKTPARQPRNITEETNFLGGMLWTANNIDTAHLKTIVNYNYDETTGFLRTRNPFLLKDYKQYQDAPDKNPSIFEQVYYDVTTGEPVTIPKHIIDDLNPRQHSLIGTYSICHKDITDVEDIKTSKAGWLYLFGILASDDTVYENTLVFVYQTAEEHWYVLTPDWDLKGSTDQLVGVQGVRPILYDNILYCTTASEDTPFNAYGIYCDTRAIGPNIVLKYYITKQALNYDGSLNPNPMNTLLFDEYCTTKNDDGSFGPFKKYYNAATNNTIHLESSRIPVDLFTDYNNPDTTVQIQGFRGEEARVAYTRIQRGTDLSKWFETPIHPIPGLPANAIAIKIKGTNNVLTIKPSENNKFYFYWNAVNTTQKLFSTMLAGISNAGVSSVENILGFEFRPYIKDNVTYIRLYSFRYYETFVAPEQYEYILETMWCDITPINNTTLQRQDLRLLNDFFNYKNYIFPNTIEELIDSVTLFEATSTGFNAFRGKDMYTYTGTLANTAAWESVSNPPYIAGAFMTDGKGNAVVTPRIGQYVTINAPLNNLPLSGSRGVIYLYRLTAGSVDDNTAIWSLVKREEEPGTTFYTSNVLITDVSNTFKIEWFKSTAEQAALYDATIVTFSSNQLNTQTKLKYYKARTAKGSCCWNGHLVLWDMQETPNTLLISEVDNFYYMPVPNNVALFDTDIISCIPYLGSLLVFTADRIYKLSENKDGAFVQDVVQNNMPISREDAPYLRAIKNMVFFKSGKYFYMLVPKTQSLTGELTIAPIYKNLAQWFEEPNTATKEILTQLNPNTNYEDVTFDKIVDVYVEQDTVTILYNLTTHGATYFNKHILPPQEMRYTLFVNYNTNLRSWTMYIEDTTDAVLFPAALTASRQMSFVRLNHNADENGTALQIVLMQESLNVDDGVPCLIDTGYRSLTPSLKKRFREVQLKLYSDTENITTFGSTFYLDGETRKSYTSLKEAYLFSVPDTISLTPAYDPNTFLTESTCPIDIYGNNILSRGEGGSDSVELSDWKLDFSHFKRGAPTTIRIPVSGKGYNPRFIFLSTKCVALHLNEINWVYRAMNGR